jgi:release factor glutamine methyltransferase
VTRGEVLREGTAGLGAPGSEARGTAALDAALLLAFQLGITREALLADPAATVEPTTRERYLTCVAQRAGGRPLAYITGRKEFYGRVFAVDDSVLVPRPDTELLVELGLSVGDLVAGRKGVPSVHECCVGSGAVALSVAAERPSWSVSGSDISEAALAVAAANEKTALPPGRAAVVFSKSDLLSDVEGKFDLIICNPPYVESPLARELAALWGEPLLALDGGPDGLDLIRRLLPEARSRLKAGGSLLVEADAAQAPALRGLFADAGFVRARSERDLAGLERVTIGELP